MRKSTRRFLNMLYKTIKNCEYIMLQCPESREYCGNRVITRAQKLYEVSLDFAFSSHIFDRELKRSWHNYCKQKEVF